MIQKTLPIFVLFLLFILSVVPMPVPEDLSSGKVGLEDAILTMRTLQETAQAPGTFIQVLEKTVSTLKAVAGLRQTVLETDHSKITTLSLKSGAPLLALSHFSFAPESYRSGFYENIIHFTDNTVTPPSPPA